MAKNRVTIRDTKRCGFCNRGVRAFMLRYGLDWSSFLKHGIDADELLATGEALAKKAVEQANVGR